MFVILLSGDKDLAVTSRDVVRIFYPSADMVLDSCVEFDFELRVYASQKENIFTGGAILYKDGMTRSEEVESDNNTPSGDERNHQKRLVKLALLRLLSRCTNTRPGPWGILTGIRPTKIVHRLLDIQRSQSEIIEYLTTNYDISDNKAELLTEIALTQRPFLLNAEQAEKKVSVYIGIPFCPTRCAYCSFPAYPVNLSGALIRPFLSALLKETESVGNLLKRLGKTVQTIYVGGGTPTVLEPDDLRLLLQSVNHFLASPDTCEITLEAGRPDTLTGEKLKTALDYGVTRLSINPQSMNRETLNAIGRCHNPEDVVFAFHLARKAGFNNINMDIILGLPGETPEHVKNTLGQISELKPENLTVHTLAVKRASHLKEAMEDYMLPEGTEVSQMLELTAGAAAQMGMKPYYLYRQKKMVGPYENTGYASQGRECLYNIQIIEERQTIIGLGGGAGSKFVEPGTWYLTSHYNPKNPENYCNRIEEIIEKKILVLNDFFSRI